MQCDCCPCEPCREDMREEGHVTAAAEMGAMRLPEGDAEH